MMQEKKKKEDMDTLADKSRKLHRDQTTLRSWLHGEQGKPNWKDKERQGAGEEGRSRVRATNRRRAEGPPKMAEDGAE